MSSCQRKGDAAVKRHMRFTPAQIIVLSFLTMITAGTLLLMLPVSTSAPGHAPFETAAFTATSAVCVTGLILEDTAQYWSYFGQAVIICLIQIGGMGVVTMAVILMMFSGRKIGFRYRWIMQESIAAPQVGGIVRMTSMILCTTLGLELCGALLLSFRFVPQYGPGRGIWFSVFHSISAFCNAGFDLMGVNGEPCVSMTAYSADPLVSLTLAALIFTGGLGFMTWKDIRDHKFRIRRYSLQSKLILFTSLILVAGGFLFLFFYEFSLPQWSYMSPGERVTASVFQTISPRTAGFNTVDLNALSAGGKLTVLMLMLVGGAPGSTAGGFKMTTLAVLMLCIKAAFAGKESTEAFGRRIGSHTVHKAAAIFMLYLLLFMGSGIFISCYDHVPIMSALFETASAIATVGLSLGITPELSTVSHIILIALMYFGRVGGLTLIYAVASGDGPDGSRLPKEQVAIG